MEPIRQQMREIMADMFWNFHYSEMKLAKSMREDPTKTLDDVIMWREQAKQSVEIARELRPEIYDRLESYDELEAL